MAKKPAEPEVPVAHDIGDILRMGGCSMLWQAQPRNQPFTVECWLTNTRRLVILQRFHEGPVNTFEEVTTAQLQEVIRNGQPA